MLCCYHPVVVISRDSDIGMLYHIGLSVPFYPLYVVFVSRNLFVCVPVVIFCGEHVLVLGTIEEGPVT